MSDKVRDMLLVALGAARNGIAPILPSQRPSSRRSQTSRLTQLIVETPEAWMEGLRTIEMPATGTEVLRGFRSGLPDAVCQGRTINSVAIYQNTSGSTNVPKTFGHFA